MLYKHLITKTTLTDISTNRTLNIVVYHLPSNNNYTHTHTHTHRVTCAHQSPFVHSGTKINKWYQQQHQTESVFSPTHPVPPSLAWTSHALTPPPFLPPLPIHMHPSTFSSHTQTHLSSDSTGKSGQTRFLAEIWTGMMLEHFSEVNLPIKLGGWTTLRARWLWAGLV